jgi:hypothetical protein
MLSSWWEKLKLEWLGGVHRGHEQDEFDPNCSGCKEEAEEDAWWWSTR